MAGCVASGNRFRDAVHRRGGAQREVRSRRGNCHLLTRWLHFSTASKRALGSESVRGVRIPGPIHNHRAAGYCTLRVHHRAAAPHAVYERKQRML